MEKLIELLNEYEKERMKTNIIPRIRTEKWNDLSYLEMSWFYSELLCISKKYGFIKWLVDNDKIDIEEMYERIWKPQIIMYDERHEEEELCEIIGVNERSYYEDLIMLLSIQDEPIYFLCDILK